MLLSHWRTKVEDQNQYFCCGRQWVKPVLNQCCTLTAAFLGIFASSDEWRKMDPGLQRIKAGICDISSLVAQGGIRDSKWQLEEAVQRPWCSEGGNQEFSRRRTLRALWVEEEESIFWWWFMSKQLEGGKGSIMFLRIWNWVLNLIEYSSYQIFLLTTLAEKSLNEVMMTCDGAMLGRHHQQKEALGLANPLLLGWIIETGLILILEGAKTSSNSLTMLVTVTMFWQSRKKGWDDYGAVYLWKLWAVGSKRQNITSEMLCVTHPRIRVE